MVYQNFIHSFIEGQSIFNLFLCSHKRSANPLTYFLKDVLRSRLKIRNLGPGAAGLYEKEIRFYQERGYWFGTVRGYCEKVGLLD